MSEQPFDLRKLKHLVKLAGGEWVGVQETVPPMLPLLLFNSKNSKSTLAVPFDPPTFVDGVLVTAVRQRIAKSDTEFQEKKMTLREKLNKLYEIIDHVEKSKHNKAQGYDYVPAVEVVRAVRKALVELKVYAEINYDFVGAPYTIAREKAPTAPFSAVNVKCFVKYLDLESDDTSTGSALGTGADLGDKSTYKAMTGSLKYALKNACLAPDERDPEADESTDEGGSGHPGGSNEMPDFQEAQHAAPRPNQPRPAAPAAQEAQKPVERPTPVPAASAGAPVASSPAPTATQPSPASSSVAAAAPSTTVVAPAVVREPGEESANTAQAPPPNAPETLGSGLLPTEAQLTVYRQKFSKLGDDLSAEGKLKSSKGLPINRKLLVFLLNIAGSQDAKTLTVGQWDNFFTRVETAKTAEGVGLLGITKLVNRANGIEEKKQ